MKTYTIKKYHHSSGISFWPAFFKRKMFKKFKFDSNCSYDLRSIDQYDINKLFGWSQLLHMKDSCRFGWVWSLEKKKMEIHAYCHVNGPRVSEWVCDIDLDTWYIGQIWLEGGKYCFRVLDENKHDILGYVSIASDFNINLGYELKPYFGGNQEAPHEMKIFLDNE